MNKFLLMALGAGILAGNLAASTIGFTVSQVGVTGTGDTLYRYVYNFAGVTLQANQDVDIRYSPSVYKSLSNPIVPVGYSPLVLQPNNPPGASGDFSVLATAAGLSTAGVFSIDFTLQTGAAPGAQSFTINQYNAQGGFLRQVEAGTTTGLGDVSLPEPGTSLLSGAGLLLAYVIGTAQRSRR